MDKDKKEVVTDPVLHKYGYQDLMEYIATNHRFEDPADDFYCKNDNGLFPWEM